MASLKSLKLSGFRNTLRRFLRKTPPAGDGSGGSSPAGSQQAGSGFLNGSPNGASSASSKDLVSPPSLDQLHASAAENHDDWSRALNGDFSDIVKSHAHDDEAAILINTAAAQQTSRHHHHTSTENLTTPDELATTDQLTTTHNPAMAPPRPLAEQTHPTQKAPVSASQLPPGEENKENVPPETLADSLAGLKIVDSPQTSDVAKTLDTAAPQEAVEADEQSKIDYSFLNDPVIAAERAQHLRFIGEALDMVRP